MKKILSVFLTVVLVMLSFSAVFAESGMSNFSQSKQYDGRFTDVKSTDWFSPHVIAAYEYGFVSGNSATTFNPNGNITIAETLVIACQLNSIYYQKEVERDVTSPWYQPYVNYAISNGIIGASDYANYTTAATRIQFAAIMAKALPDEALLPIGSIRLIPDVPKDMKNADAVYKLYNAGILSGSDEYGSFKPSSNIKRSEVSVIAINMADAARRKAPVLKALPSITIVESASTKKVDYTLGQATLTHNIGAYSDSYFALVEIKNTGTQPIYMGTCEYEIQDNYGHVLQTVTLVSSSHDVIPVGESGYYYSDFYLDEGVTADNGIRVFARINLEKSKQNAVRYSLSDLTLREGSSGPTVTGKVTNTTTEKDSLLYLVVIYYNKAGDVIDITGTNILGLEAGETRGFEVSGIMLNKGTTMDTIANYKVIAEKMYMQFSW